MMQRVLVGVKRVIDYSVTVRVKPDFTGVVKQNVKMSMNPFCEIALEEAVRMKEKKQVQEVVTVTIGPKEAQETLRTSLAKGADRSIHILTDNDELEPLAIAKLLRKISEKEKPNLIFLGKQAIDDDASQTPQILAGLLRWHQATFASKCEIKDANQIAVTREIDGGLESILLKLPAVISCDLRLNQPRFANIPSIMAAKKKPLETINLQDLGIDVTSHNKTIKVTEPQQKKGGVQLAPSVEELLQKLKTQAKVI